MLESTGHHEVPQLHAVTDGRVAILDDTPPYSPEIYMFFLCTFRGSCSILCPKNLGSDFYPAPMLSSKPMFTARSFFGSVPRSP